MGKGDRRGRKANPAQVPELAPIISQKHRRTRDKGRFVAKAEDPRITALTARCHQAGIEMTDPRAARSRAAAPWLGCDLGRVMNASLNQDQCSAAWSVWQAFCAAERNYRTRILGITGDPQNSAITILPEKLQADDGHTIDTRTADERDRDAVNAWMRWRGYVGCLTSTDASLLFLAERDQGRDLWRHREPTPRGLQTLSALIALCDAVERYGR